MTVHTHGAAGTEQHPADVAQQETSKVAQEATQQARDVAGEFRSQVGQQAEQQRTKAVEGLKSLGDGLNSMAEGGGPGPAQDLVREVATRAETLARYVEGRDASELLDDLRAMARQRPMLFLAGAAVAGAVAGRLSRGVLSAATGGQGLTGSSEPEIRRPLVTTDADTDIMLPGTSGPRTTGTGYPAADPYAPVAPAPGVVGGDATLGAMGSTTGREEPPRASGTQGSFHG